MSRFYSRVHVYGQTPREFRVLHDALLRHGFERTESTAAHGNAAATTEARYSFDSPRAGVGERERVNALVATSARASGVRACVVTVEASGAFHAVV